MTVEELLEIATRHVQAAKDENDFECAMRYAATAQAAAATAQAMILAQTTSENAEGTRRWLRVDTGN